MQNEPHIIYLITNTVNGKKYVGLTKHGIDKRWTWHVKDACKGSTRVLMQAIRKYGVDSFTREVIAEAPNVVEARILEIYWIDKLQSFGKDGYNMTTGGEGVSGVIVTDERRKQLSAQSSGDKNYWYGKRGSEHYGYGKKLGDAHIEKLRKTNTWSVPIVINGVIYPSKAEAGRIFGVPKPSVPRLADWEKEVGKIQHYRVEIDGVRYFGIKEAAKQLGTTKYKLDRQITVQGRGRYITDPYTFDEFVAYLQNIGAPKTAVIYCDVYYKSVRELCLSSGMDKDKVKRLIREGEIIETEVRESVHTHNSIRVSFCGEVFNSKTELMTFYSISGKEFNRLLDSGDIGVVE